MDKKWIAKVALTRLGSMCTARTMYNLNGGFNYLHTGWWLREHDFEPLTEVRSRADVFTHIANEVRDRDVLYLEFGVHRGASMRQWSHLLRNPNSKLHGFDSFLGLPHDWSLEGHPRGYFSTGGNLPKIDDPRVRFFAGWFDETLPAYLWPSYEVLIVMLDADLYSSTAAVLAHVQEKLVPGSFLYFDQFHHRCDELRAFAELVNETSFRFELAVASRDRSNLAFRRLD